MSETRNLRRYALHKRRAAEEMGDIAIRDVWASKQEEIAGTALPDDFPERTRLVSLYYSTLEDLDGADEHELCALGFSMQMAAKILAAAAS